jgi:hypothetical protein
MDKADFRIYAGVDNQIEFALRKKDRKVVNIVGRRVRLVLKNRYTNEILAQPFLTVVDTDRAIMMLNLPKELTMHWPVGALSYGAIVEEPDGTELLLFVDEAERGQAFCYVMASPVAVITPAGTSKVYNFPRLKANVSHTFRIKLEKDGVAFNTTGYTFEMQIRAEQSPLSAVLATLNTELGGMNVVHEAGSTYLEIKFGPFSTVLTKIDTYYDIIATKNDEETVWLEGLIPLEPGVTYT